LGRVRSESGRGSSVGYVRRTGPQITNAPHSRHFMALLPRRSCVSGGGAALCAAISTARDPYTKARMRCRQPVAPGTPFCKAYHATPADRKFGTIWERTDVGVPAPRPLLAAPRPPPPHLARAAYPLLVGGGGGILAGQAAPLVAGGFSVGAGWLPGMLAPPQPPYGHALQPFGGAAARPPRGIDPAARPMMAVAAEMPVALPAPRPAAMRHASPAAAAAPLMAFPACAPAASSGGGSRVLFPHPAGREFESRYIGPSGIRLRIRLATVLQVSACRALRQLPSRSTEHASAPQPTIPSPNSPLSPLSAARQLVRGAATLPERAGGGGAAGSAPAAARQPQR
jgi:hypothetical protein